MYQSKNNQYHQVTFFDFNQSCGMQLDKDNEWVRLADRIDWKSLEKPYSENFPSKLGHPAKPLRMALGALIIQKRKGLSDRRLVAEIMENPYLQYFIGLTKFSNERPFCAVALVDFRKRLNVEILMLANELFLEDAAPTPEHSGDGATADADAGNLGTAIMDATCSPSNIRYPQDFELLNEAREKLEEMIDSFHRLYHPWKKPRTYRKVARKEYLELAKMKRRPAKKIRSTIRKQLGHVRRDLGHLADYMGAGYVPEKKHIGCYLTIVKLYEQQKYMFDNKTHSVEGRIVSIRQPYVRPIVRGKAKSPVEFGAKYDVSMDEKGHARLEKISFDPYNESTVFKAAMERYRQRTGHYPERVLVDQIYRTRANRDFCKEHGIRMSGPKLGRPSKDHKNTEQERRDNADRIEIERFFSVDKRCNGAGLIMTKLDTTTLSSIALSVFVTNLFAIPCPSFFLLCFMDVGEDVGGQYYMEFQDAAWT